MIFELKMAVACLLADIAESNLTFEKLLLPYCIELEMGCILVAFLFSEFLEI